MKIKFALFCAVFFAVTKLYGQVSDNCVANVILSGYSEKAYITEL